MRRALPVLLALACSAAAAPPALAVDLTVSGVEVTQATQKADNSISLVALRSTAVRATIGVADSGGAAVAGVTGRLHVFRDGAEITPAAGVAPLTPLNAPVAPQRANENDTLNFELPAAVLDQLTASNDVDFRVDVTPVAGEANAGNNSGAANNLKIVAGVVPSLFFTRINYTPAGLGLPADNLIQPGAGDAFVRGILPVNDRDPNLYRQGLFPSLSFSGDTDGDNLLENDGDVDALLSLLGSCRQLIVDNGLGANDTTFLFGWLAGNPIGGNGWATVNGRNAFGNTDPTRHQRSYAHELTHNLGFNHINTNIDQVGWDVGARLANNPAGNNTTGRVKPTTLFDIQVGGLLTPQAWVDTPKYISLLGSNSLGFGAGGDAAGDKSRDKRNRRRVAVIQGTLSTKGDELRELKPVFRFPWLSRPTPQPRNSRYQVEVRTSAGTIRAPFNGGTHDDSLADTKAFGYFEVMVPTGRQISAIRILDRAQKKALGRLVRSRRPPTIRILSPEPKGVLGEKTEIRWQARDRDTGAARLRYQVAYSPDGGNDFVPIAVDLKDSKVTFDSTQIQRSNGQGLIRVYVSDGLNTSFADVTGLTAAAGKF